uniref:Uncharacterized protein n=1 Tax=Pavo cristatus TaxID=9049 RepID=A0A8C9F5G1_PAVCR
MLALFSELLDLFQVLFWKEEMVLTLVGLQLTETTFASVIASGQFNEDTVLKVGFSMRRTTKGNITVKLRDVGDQLHFHNKLQLQSIPGLVLGIKGDTSGALDEKELI